MNTPIMISVAAAAALALSGCATYGDAETNASATAQSSFVGGAEMFPSKNIIENAVESPIHTTLVAAVKAAGLVETLSSPGPFTVFAPTNAAFDKLPAGTVDTVLKPENKALLTKILTYHVVAGKVTAENVISAINAGGGTATLTTVQGEKLTAKLMGGNVVVMGQGGSMATVTQADVNQSNGTIHVIDSVLMPSM